MDAASTPPTWTELEQKFGVDPLGMQNASTVLYQSLLPGISNVTLRIRYYGLYPWLCDRYARHVGNPDDAVWKRYVRAAEAVYALIAQRVGGETGVAGITWAAEQLQPGVTSIPFAKIDEDGDRRYLANAWGVYGGAYYSQLKEVGLIAHTEAHGVPVPGKGAGEVLANCFAPGSLGDRYFSVITSGSVTLDDLDALAPLAPSRIPEGSEEQKTYVSALFGLKEHEAPSLANTHSRSRSLQLILRMADSFGRVPSANEIRWGAYTGTLPSGEAISGLQPQLEEQRRRWWVYQLSDLWHICCEALLRYTLDVLDEYPSGAHLGTLVSECVARVQRELPKPSVAWSEFRSTRLVAANGWGPGASENSEFSVQNRLIRAGNANAVMTPLLALEALNLMSVLATKEREGRELISECLRGRGGAGARSILTESAFLDGLDGETFANALHRILSERIIHRHLGVALAKLRHQRDYTFLIESDEGRVRLRHKAGPVVTEPRLDTTLRFLSDLRLITASGLSDRGRALV